MSLGSDQKPAASVPLHVEAFHRTWTTAKKREADGSEQYVSTPNDTLVDASDVRTDAQGKAVYQFAPQRGGQYRLAVSGHDASGNPLRAATSLYVSASELLSWQVNNNDRIDLVADKESYAAGDVAHVLVPAPFAGATGLVTVERGRVLDHHLQDFPTNSTVVDVPITADMAPTVYLSVVLLKPGSGETSVAAYRLGYVQLKVSPEAHRLTVSVKPDRTQLGVSLNIANQAFATQASGGKGGAGGGDVGSGDLRRTFQNTAFWQAAVRTDAAGQARVAVKLPDNLTTWRIGARGVTADTAAGDGSASAVTSRDLNVRPVAPRFFTAGDAARLGAIVNNQTSASLDVSVSLTAQGLDVKSGVQKLTVPAHGSANVGWETAVGDGPSAKVTWEAKATGGPSDAAELTLPVNDRTTPETVASAGVVTSGEAEERIQIPSDALANKGQIAIELAPSLAGVLKLASSYLESWPYEPADITAARLLDRVGNWQAAIKLNRPANEQTAARDTATQATKYLSDIYNQPTDALHLTGPDDRASILLALAAAGTGSADRERALAEQRSSLGSSGKGALLQALLLDGVSSDDPTLRALANELTAAAVVSATGSHWEDAKLPGRPDANSTRATSLVLSGLLRLDAHQPLLDGAVRWLAATRQRGHWRSPDETALAVEAIAGFVVAREAPVAGLTYAVSVNGRPAGSGDFQKDGPQTTARVNVPLQGLPTGSDLPVTIAKQGDGQLYYGLFLSYYTAAQGVSARANGLTVGREFLPAEGDTPVTQVKNGDLVRVKLTFVAPTDLQYVRVEDYLPAGLEAVDGSLKTADPNLVLRQRQEQQKLLQPPATLAQSGSLTLITDRRRRLVNPFDHVEARDDRVALFATTLSRGVHEYVYFARATIAGTFTVPPVTAEESDYPDVFGRSDSGTLSVTP